MHQQHLLALQQLDEARQNIRQAQALGMDDDIFHYGLCARPDIPILKQAKAEYAKLQ